MAITSAAVVNSLLASFAAAKGSDRPYRHWIVKDCLPAGAVEAINGLPFPAPSLDGISGKREVHNATRKYFDVENRARFPVVGAVADALQDARVTGAVEKTFGTKLAGTYLRIEYAQDTNGFWLEPHTDLGVKLFTMLLYISKDVAHRGLGTDIYDADKKYVARSPFAFNTAFVFVPSTNTYHGFEPRRIEGVPHHRFASGMKAHAAALPDRNQDRIRRQAIGDQGRGVAVTTLQPLQFKRLAVAGRARAENCQQHRDDRDDTPHPRARGHLYRNRARQNEQQHECGN